MKRKDGKARSDYDFELDDLILDLMMEKKIINPDRIRTILNERYSRKLGWVTIKRHLDKLMEQKVIRVYYESDEGKKKVRLYKINDSSKIMSIRLK
mgnify:CR=1 FL=1